MREVDGTAFQWNMEHIHRQFEDNCPRRETGFIPLFSLVSCVDSGRTPSCKAQKDV